MIDLGAGDGRWAYESARKDPASLYIAVDPDADALAEYAYRAARKPARGGTGNVRFVVASLQALPPELLGIGGRVRVNFPWVGLLRGLIRPELGAIKALSSLGTSEATFEVVLCYDAEHDIAALEGEALPALDASYIETTLIPGYAEAGLKVTTYEALSQDEALAIPSSWGRKLLHGRSRQVFLIQAVQGASQSDRQIG